MAGLSRKETRQLLDGLAAQGCDVVEATNAAKVLFPDGSFMFVHWTNSDRKSQDAQRAVVKRAGLLWPFDDRRAMRQEAKRLRGRS